MTHPPIGEVELGTGAAHRTFDTPAELGEAAAAVITNGIRESSDGRRYLLGCPGGRTPRVIFDALGRLCADQEIDCSRVVIVMMDDYLETGALTPTLVSIAAHNSCRRFAEHEIRRVINRDLPTEMGIPRTSIWLPDPTDPSRYDQQLTDAGGVDLFLVASGASDGHVAFCGPGSDIDGITSIVTLAPSTRADNTVTFPEFASADDVPTEGVSVGLGTIRNHSRSVLMVLHGKDKQESARRLETTTCYDSEWPATFIHECREPQIWSDAAASPRSSRRKDTR
jgi:glucosamine-6-phosphate deaminase